MNSRFGSDDPGSARRQNLPGCLSSLPEEIEVRRAARRQKRILPWLIGAILR